MEAYKCPKCGKIHKGYPLCCYVCGCLMFELIEIIDWDKELLGEQSCFKY